MFARLLDSKSARGSRFGYRLSIALALALALVASGALGLAIGTAYTHATEARESAK